MTAGVVVERGHPRNRILIDSADSRQTMVDTTGLTWQMLGAARVAMDGDILEYVENPDLRPQDILVGYARARNDPSHMGHVWRTIPVELRSGPPVNEQTRFTSFFFALRRWRIESARYLAGCGWYRSMRRYTGPGLLYVPPRDSFPLSQYTCTTGRPPQWQVIPAADSDDYADRASMTMEQMTQRALRAGGLNADEIAAEWPHGGASAMSERLELPSIGRLQFR